MKFYIYKRYTETDYGYYWPKVYESWTRVAELDGTLEDAQKQALELAHADRSSFGETEVSEVETVPAWFEPSGKIETSGRVFCESRPLPHYTLEYVVLTKDIGEHHDRDRQGK